METLIFIWNTIFSLQIADLKIFIGDPQFFVLPQFSLENPSIVIGDPKIFDLNPWFSLTTPRLFRESFRSLETLVRERRQVKISFLVLIKKPLHFLRFWGSTNVSHTAWTYYIRGYSSPQFVISTTQTCLVACSLLNL